MRVVNRRLWRGECPGSRTRRAGLGTARTLSGILHHDVTKFRHFADLGEDSRAIDESETPRESKSLVSSLAEKVELSVQGAFALAFGAALIVSAANILFKVGVITFALVTVAIRYTIVGILLAVIVACVL